MRPAGPRFDEAGNWQWPPIVYGLKAETDLATFRKVFTPNPDRADPHPLFGHGKPYKLLGLFPINSHLFTVDAPAVIFLMGTDSTGRDLYSRILYGGRISLSVGLVGVVLSLFLGAF